MKFIFRALCVIGVIVPMAFFVWRAKAPSWHGQQLRHTLSVDSNFEIIFVGDTGTGEAAQKEVALAMETYCERQKPRAIVLLGDNFYYEGVESVDDPLWNRIFQDVYRFPCLGTVPFYALLGNHDYRENPAAQIAYRSQNPSWHMPHRFYELNFGDRLQLIMIDTNVLDFCGMSSHCTFDFLRERLAQRQKRVPIVLGHHPLANASIKYQKTMMQSRLLERYLCQNAPIYIAGHAHHLEHRRVDNCDLDSFISGGGGAHLYEVRSGVPQTRFAQSQHGFLRLQVNPEVLNFAFFNTRLESLYAYNRFEPGALRADSRP